MSLPRGAEDLPRQASTGSRRRLRVFRSAVVLIIATETLLLLKMQVATDPTTYASIASRDKL